MSLAFQVFIMWVLYCAGYAPFGLTIGFTIAMGIATFVSAIKDTIKERNGDK